MADTAVRWEEMRARSGGRTEKGAAGRYTIQFERCGLFMRLGSMQKVSTLWICVDLPTNKQQRNWRIFANLGVDSCRLTSVDSFMRGMCVIAGAGKDLVL